MDNLTTPGKQVNIISNVAINPVEVKQSTLSTNEKFGYSTGENIHEVTKNLQRENTFESKAPNIFANLSFELPRGTSKRKNSCHGEANEKKARMEEEEIKIFNYMTGTYEIVKTPIEEESVEDYIELMDEPVLVIEQDLKKGEEVEDTSIFKKEIVQQFNGEYSVNSLDIQDVNTNNYINMARVPLISKGIIKSPKVLEKQGEQIEDPYLHKTHLNQHPIVDEYSTNSLTDISLSNVIANNIVSEGSLGAKGSVRTVANALPSVDIEQPTNSSVLEYLLKQEAPLTQNTKSINAALFGVDFSLQGQKPIDMTPNPIVNSSPGKIISTKENTNLQQLENIKMNLKPVTNSAGTSLQSNNQCLFVNYLTSKTNYAAESVKSNSRPKITSVDLNLSKSSPSRINSASNSNYVSANSNLVPSEPSSDETEISRTRKVDHISSAKLQSNKLGKSRVCGPFKTWFPKERYYKCESCSYATKTKFNLTSHIYDSHVTKEFVRQFKCNYCEFQFDDESELERHMNNHKGSLTQPKCHPISKAKIVESSGHINNEDSSKPNGIKDLTTETYYCQICGNHTKGLLCCEFSSSQIKKNGGKKLPRISYKELMVVLRREDFRTRDGLVSGAENVIKNQLPSNDVNGNANNFIQFKCFDCDTVFEEKKELEVHAFLIHSYSLFHCVLHFPKNDALICSKCNYASILRNMQNPSENYRKHQNEKHIIESEISSPIREVKDLDDSENILNRTDFSLSIRPNVLECELSNDIAKHRKNKQNPLAIVEWPSKTSNNLKSTSLNILRQCNKRFAINKSDENQTSILIESDDDTTDIIEKEGVNSELPDRDGKTVLQVDEKVTKTTRTSSIQVTNVGDSDGDILTRPNLSPSMEPSVLESELSNDIDKHRKNKQNPLSDVECPSVKTSGNSKSILLNILKQCDKNFTINKNDGNQTSILIESDDDTTDIVEKESVNSEHFDRHDKTLLQMDEKVTKTTSTGPIQQVTHVGESDDVGDITRIDLSPSIRPNVSECELSNDIDKHCKNTQNPLFYVEGPSVKTSNNSKSILLDILKKCDKSFTINKGDGEQTSILIESDDDTTDIVEKESVNSEQPDRRNKTVLEMDEKVAKTTRTGPIQEVTHVGDSDDGGNILTRIDLSPSIRPNVSERELSNDIDKHSKNKQNPLFYVECPSLKTSNNSKSILLDILKQCNKSFAINKNDGNQTSILIESDDDTTDIVEKESVNSEQSDRGKKTVLQVDKKVTKITRTGRIQEVTHVGDSDDGGNILTRIDLSPTIRPNASERELSNDTGKHSKNKQNMLFYVECPSVKTSNNSKSILLDILKQCNKSFAINKNDGNQTSILIESDDDTTDIVEKETVNSEQPNRHDKTLLQVDEKATETTRTGSIQELINVGDSGDGGDVLTRIDLSPSIRPNVSECELSNDIDKHRKNKQNPLSDVECSSVKTSNNSTSVLLNIRKQCDKSFAINKSDGEQSSILIESDDDTTDIVEKESVNSEQPDRGKKNVLQEDEQVTKTTAGPIQEVTHVDDSDVGDILTRIDLCPSIGPNISECELSNDIDKHCKNKQNPFSDVECSSVKTSNNSKSISLNILKQCDKIFAVNKSDGNQTVKLIERDVDTTDIVEKESVNSEQLDMHNKKLLQVDEKRTETTRTSPIQELMNVGDSDDGGDVLTRIDLSPSMRPNVSECELSNDIDKHCRNMQNPLSDVECPSVKTSNNSKSVLLNILKQCDKSFAFNKSDGNRTSILIESDDDVTEIAEEGSVNIDQSDRDNETVLQVNGKVPKATSAADRSVSGLNNLDIFQTNHDHTSQTDRYRADITWTDDDNSVGEQSLSENEVSEDIISRKENPLIISESFSHNINPKFRIIKTGREIDEHVEDVMFKEYKCCDCNNFSTYLIDKLKAHKCNFKTLNSHTTNDCKQASDARPTTQADNANSFRAKKVEESQHKEVKPSKKEMSGIVFKCFYCNYEFTSRSSLVYHCKQHIDKSFKCDIHSELKRLYCQKCTFQVVLSQVKKSLLVCKKCNFKTFHGIRFKLHEDRDCDIVVKSQPQLFFKCFDCYSVYNNISGLKRHALSHIGSKFVCTDHKSFVQSCLQCFYHNILKDIQNNTFTCQKCGFKTCNSYELRRHENDDTKCQLYKENHITQGEVVAVEPAKTYICFDCDFSHERLDFMKKHVEVHRRSQFKCDLHTKSEDDCPKCFYVQLLAQVPKARICCFDCDWRPIFRQVPTLVNHVSQVHKDSFFACTLHPNRKCDYCGKCLYQEVVKEVMGSDYVKLKCWDCRGTLFSGKITFKEHIKNSHLKSKFICVKHARRQMKDCNKCAYQKFLKSCKMANWAMFRCFDCDYSINTLNDFTCHVRTKHPKSKVRCNEHSNRNFDNHYCPECFYRAIVSSSCSLIRCYECESPTAFINEGRLKNHVLKVHKNCSFVCTWHTRKTANCIRCWCQSYSQKALEEAAFHCFNCSYQAYELSVLIHHVREQHEGSHFKCEEHNIIGAADDCQMCSYAKLLLNLRDMQCYECPTTTRPRFHSIQNLKQHIYKTHKSPIFVCPHHSSINNCCNCLFQDLVKETFRFTCCDCSIAPFPDKNALMRHVKKTHEKSSFTCVLHCFYPEPDSCHKCVYGELVQMCTKDAGGVATNSSTDILVVFECFDCDYRTNAGHLMKIHIKHKHMDSSFTCSKHDLGEISRTCRECAYENLVLLANEGSSY